MTKETYNKQETRTDEKVAIMKKQKHDERNLTNKKQEHTKK